ncbi:MAG: type II toxin-antitoxin system VapC family toxin [Cycloclasticus sp.]|nr:type II toxin-antitoxin system VapC family toxin [Cycloclasticus sp.]
MIAIDTNIIIRLLANDEPAQYKKAYTVFNTQEIFIPDTVILETEWVLRYAYEFSPKEICDSLTKLFGLKNIHLSNPASIFQAIDWHRKGLDFSDALHLTQCQQHKKLYTFDKAFATKAKKQSNCIVELL